MNTFQSHRWGFAALPEGLDMPYRGEGNPMTLIAQFELGEGAVWLFADLDYWFGDLDAESGPIGEWDASFFKVLYAPTRENVHLHEVRYADGTSAVPSERPFSSDSSGEWRDEIEQDYPGYDVLLQLEEDDEIGLRFYDCGSLFFLITPEDLAARNFDAVKCVLYSY